MPNTFRLPRRWQPDNLAPPLRAALRAGVVHEGSLNRLALALVRLQRGEGLTVAGVGSSMMADFGGVVGSMQAQAELGHMGTARTCGGGCVRPGWMFPMCSVLHDQWTSNASGTKPGVRLVNCGLPSCSLDCFLDCTATKVPTDADVIVVEAASIGATPLIAEKLLRRLLALPHRPALILVHLFAWCHEGALQMLHGRLPGIGVGGEMHRNKSCYGEQPLWRSWRRAEQLETPLDALGVRYGLPTLSTRRAFFDAARRSESVTKASSGTADAGGSGVWFKPSVLTRDGLHPSEKVWARRTYEHLIGSLLSQFMHDRRRELGERAAALASSAVATAANATVAADDHPACVAPVDKLAADVAQSERCFAWGNAAVLAWHNMQVAPELLPARRGGGSPRWNRTVFDTASVAEPDARCHWAGHTKGCPKPKPGFTAWDAAAVAELRLSLSGELQRTQHRDGDGEADHGVAGVLKLRYMTSYEAMGIARVSCVGGCVCDAEDIDAHRGASHSQRSVSVWESREVRLRLQAAHCTLRLRVLPRTSSGGHKFKLGALRVAWGRATPKCTDGHTYNHVT